MRVRAEVIDVVELINKSRLSGLQITTFVLCALVALLDGIDTQSIGVAAPYIAEHMRMSMSGFGPIFAATLFGAMLGALTFGPLADRFGRKTMLVLATVTFAIFTFLTALASSFGTLVACRFLTGIGLGGATPCFIALTSEYAPLRIRNLVVTAQWAAFPLGGLLGGLLNSYVIYALGWRALFYIGAVLPLGVAVLLAVKLPESFRFLLARRPGATRQIRRIGSALTGEAIDEGIRFVSREERLGGLSLKHLFMKGRAIPTVLLWVPFFMGFGVLSVVTLWTPALLRAHGIRGPPRPSSSRSTGLVRASARRPPGR